MYTVGIKEGERFYLRRILNFEKGAQSYEDLRTVEVDGENIVMETFEEACRAKGYMDSEEDWEKYFEEAVSIGSPKKVRELFVTLIHHGVEINVKGIWEKFKFAMSEDYLYKLIEREKVRGIRPGTVYQINDPFELKNSEKYDELREKAIKQALGEIERQLDVVNTSLIKYGIKIPEDVLFEEKEFDKEKELEEGKRRVTTLNRKQKRVVEHILKNVAKLNKNELSNGCAMMCGQGGSGKTYVVQTLCHLFRGVGIKYKCSSYMGIAAMLLPDGRTMHKTFGLPYDLDKDSSSSAQRNNKLGQELIDTKVFFIDEVSMVSNYIMDIIDKKLQELMENDMPFGGKVMVVCGDFRQTLLIERNASRARLVSLSLRKSELWKYFKPNVFELKENKRAQQIVNSNVDVPEQEDFASFLLKMGNGELQEDKNGFVEIPENVVAKKSVVDEIFGGFLNKKQLTDEDYEKMAKRVIMTTTNEKVDDINDEVLSKLADKLKEIFSIDKVDQEKPKNYDEFPLEYLHSLNDPGLPPHILKLKVNCPVMLLRNLNPAAGLCNGTRLIVKTIHNKWLECKIINGEFEDNVWIPKIYLTSDEKRRPFVLSRKQFPVKLCFAMTINKSQGQTIDYAGLDLVEPVFAHGMTYVGFSRARAWEFLRVAVDKKIGNKIKNEVYKEVLLTPEDIREDIGPEVTIKEIEDIVDRLIEESQVQLLVSGI